MADIEEKIESKIVAVRVRALKQLKEEYEKELESLKINIEYINTELELAYQMMDYPHKFKLFRVDGDD